MGSSFASAVQARQQAMVLPEDPPWWELFNATKDEITVVSKTILTLYAYVHWIVFSCASSVACCGPHVVRCTHAQLAT